MDKDTFNPSIHRPLVAPTCAYLGSCDPYSDTADPTHFEEPVQSIRQRLPTREAYSSQSRALPSKFSETGLKQMDLGYESRLYHKTGKVHFIRVWVLGLPMRRRARQIVNRVCVAAE